MSWLSTSSGALLETGRDAGSVLGVGKEVGVTIDRLKSTDLVDQAVSLLRMILKPVFVTIWALGALAIVLLPRIFRALARTFRIRRH